MKYIKTLAGTVWKRKTEVIMAKKVLAVISLFLVSAVLTAASQAGDIITRRATGVVVAASTASEPNTIVVKSKNWKGHELIVGADVDDRTVIRKDGKSIGLNGVNNGDRVDIVYERNDRVVAKSITVKTK